jgi:hypothetical protein
VNLPRKNQIEIDDTIDRFGFDGVVGRGNETNAFTAIFCPADCAIA